MRRNEHVDGKKHCPTCDKWFPATQEYFSQKKNRWDGLYPQCKSCQKNYRDNNKEMLAALNGARYERDKERIKAVQKKWFDENIDKKYITDRKYALSEKGRKTRLVNQQQRDARALSLPCDLTQKQWSETLASFNNCCAYCGSQTEALTQDHIVPLSKGGGYTKFNIIPACPSCNFRKNNKQMEEWYVKQDFFSLDRLTYINKFAESLIVHE